MSRDRLTEAVDLIDRALSMEPTDARLLNVKAVALYSLDRLSEAEAACGRVLEDNPDYLWAESNLAKTLSLQNKIDEALKAGKIAPSTKGYYVKTCQSEEGLQNFRDFVKSAPQIIAEVPANDEIEVNDSKVITASDKLVMEKLGLTQESYLTARATI